MGKGSLKEKINRRDSLLGLLRSGNIWTINTLSKELGVSSRTVTRDLEELRDSGIPIEAERGKGGGLRLSGRWGVDRLNLTNPEVVSLLVALAITETLSPSLVATHSKSLRHKIALSFPETQRRKIDELRSRILFGDTASQHILSTYEVPDSDLMEKLNFSFFTSHKIKIQYQSESRSITKRIVEPHYLLLNWPVWYLLAWGELREDVRLFRTDRILQIDQLNEPNKRRSRSVFLKSLDEYFKSI